MAFDDSASPWPGRLSAAARSVWAKHDRDTGDWLPLWRHMADSAAVADRLWDEWLPRQVRRLIAAALPGGEDDARRLAVWLAATHDIGKATPAFACQVEELAAAMRRTGLDMPLHKQMPDRKAAPITWPGRSCSSSGSSNGMVGTSAKHFRGRSSRAATTGCHPRTMS